MGLSMALPILRSGGIPRRSEAIPRYDLVHLPKHLELTLHQSSIVILTYHQYPALFSALASILGPLFQSHEIPMLESACHNIATWYICLKIPHHEVIDACPQRKAGPNTRRDLGAWLPRYGFTRRDPTFSRHSTTDGDIFFQREIQSEASCWCFKDL